MSKVFKQDVSIRKIHIALIVVLVLMSGAVFYATFYLTGSFIRINSAYKESMDLQKAAHELMDASDYLTEQVQRFTINGDRIYLERYFTEAFESNRREEAISKLSLGGAKTDAALKQLQEAMENSLNLMNQEYYAMRLVIEAKGYTDYPEILNNVTLSAADAALDPEDQIRRATELVLNEDYYELKDRIRSDMRESLDEIEKLAKSAEEAEYASLKRSINFVVIVIILHAVTILFMLWLTTRMGVKPILRAVDNIRADLPIPEEGAREYRYLAMAYNRMYKKNKTSLERLSFKASHDELTGAYNRAGYDYLVTELDLSTTYMMLFDVDNFKFINDTYGHETGDLILKKLVHVMMSVFRDDDCICRIGGDEFVVFMVHSAGIPRRLIESKIIQINEELEKTDDGLPPISISVGVANGKNITDKDTLFEKADAAMYEAKKQGKHTYTFYTD